MRIHQDHRVGHQLRPNTRCIGSLGLHSGSTMGHQVRYVGASGGAANASAHCSFTPAAIFDITCRHATDARLRLCAAST
jgi:hypothetical protein